MRTLHRALFGSALLGIAGAMPTACTVSSTPAPDQNVSQFCADWAKAICQLSNQSCDFTSAACTTFQTSQCMASVSTQQMVAPSRQYSQANGKACIDALNGAYGNNPTTVLAATLQMVQTLCSKVVIGSQASDQSCSDTNDCSGSLVCSAPPGAAGGAVCAAVTQKNLGDICGDPGDQCQGDSYCAAQTSGYPKCVATATTGGACNATIPCGPSDHCVGGSCAARGALHDSCTTSDDCNPDAPYCDTFYEPHWECTKGLSFAPGSYDCNGVVMGPSNGAPDAGGGTGSDGGGSGADGAPSGGDGGADSASE